MKKDSLTELNKIIKDLKTRKASMKKKEMKLKDIKNFNDAMAYVYAHEKK